MKRKALDLFCGAGGAAAGLAKAGFEVCGVDIRPQPRYPFRFLQGDALQVLDNLIRTGEVKEYSLIWCSPPCQRFSAMTKRWGPSAVEQHPDVLSGLRSLLQQSGADYVIENVEGAPLQKTLLLCGTMFDLQTDSGVPLRRHRIFECSFYVPQPACRHKKGVHSIGIYGGGQHPKRKTAVCGYSLADRKKAMGIDWMTWAELNESVPPAYSYYIAQWYLKDKQHIEAEVKTG